MGSSSIGFTNTARCRIVEVTCCRGRAPLLASRQVLSSLIAAAVRDHCQYITYTCGSEMYAHSPCAREHLDSPDDMLSELAGLLLTAEIEGRSQMVIWGSLLSSVCCSRRRDELVLEFALTPLAIAAFHPDNPYSNSNIAEALFFSSKYAPPLLRLVRERFPHGVQQIYLSLSELRQLFGIGDEKYVNWHDFRRFVLDPAAGEINAVAHVDISTTERRQSRKVIGVDLHFAAKPWLSYVHQSSFRGVTCDPPAAQYAP